MLMTGHTPLLTLSLHKNGGLLFKIILVVLPLLLIACNDNTVGGSSFSAASPSKDAAPKKSAVQTQAPETPQISTETPQASINHNYILLNDEGFYGYQPGVSENEVNNGLASTPLVMVLYVGMIDGKYTFNIRGSNQNNFEQITCKAPCDFFDDATIINGVTVNTRTMRFTPRTIAAGIIEDAKNGYLKNLAQIMADADNPAINPREFKGASFDCKRAFHHDEKTICASIKLSDMDRELSLLYNIALKSAADDGARKLLRDEQNDQLKNRRLCQENYDCIIDWYRRRMVAFDPKYGAGF